MRRLIETPCQCGGMECTCAEVPCNALDDPSSSESDTKQKSPPDWNLFLTDKGPHASRQWKARRGQTSPIYSLSSPSPCSPTVFAGLEGHVIELNFTSVYDRFPDPIFKFGSKRIRWRYKGAVQQQDVIPKWDPYQEVMCLAMYEQVSGPPTLKQQAPIGEPGHDIPGWDERWKHIRVKGN